MAKTLRDFYFGYIACLNGKAWPDLQAFVAADVVHNGRRLGLHGYRDLMKQHYLDVPDLRYDVELLATDAPLIAARLRFDCSPTGSVLGFPVDGRRVTFCENAFYLLEDGRIAEVRSIIDKMAIERQLAS